MKLPDFAMIWTYKMPIYQYQCNECLFILSKLCSVSRAEEKEGPLCPKCDSGTQRILSGGVVRGPTPNHHGVPRDKDPGFNREYDSIWKGDPLVRGGEE